MNGALYFDGVRYIAAADAAERGALSSDYIGLICRQGKVQAKQIDRRWYVDPHSLERFLAAQVARKEQRRAELSAELGAVAQKAQAQKRTLNDSHLPAARPFARTAAAFALIAAAAILVAIPQASASVLSTLADVTALATGNSGAWRTLDHEIAIGLGTTNSVAQSAQPAAVVSAFSDSPATSDSIAAATTSGSNTSVTPMENVSRATSSHNSAASQTYGSQTIIERITEQPIIQQYPAVAGSFVTQNELSSSVSALGDSLRQLISQNYQNPLVSGPAAPITAENFAPSQQIDQLNGTTITNANLTASEIPTNIVAANYLPLSGGTLTGALNVSTLSASSTSYGTLTSTDASTTNFSVFANAYFGGTATSSFDSAGDLVVAGNTTLASATSTNFFSTTASSTNLFATAATIGSALLSSLTANSATTTNLVATAAAITSLTATNATTTNATSTNFYVSGNTTLADATSTNFFATNASTTNATSTNLFAAIGTFTTGVIDALSGTTLSYVNASTSNATSTNLYAASAVIPTLSATNATFTDATSTDIFSAVGDFTTGIINALSGTTLTYIAASTTNLSVEGIAYFGGTATSSFDNAGDLSVAGNTTLQNATTTSLFVKSAFQTPNATIGALTATSSLTSYNATIGALTATNTLAVSGTSAFTNLATFANASTTLFSAYGPAYFGGTATSSFDSAGDLSVAGNTTLQNATTTSLFVKSALSASSANFGATATSSFGTDGQLSLANLANALLAVNSSGQVVATSTIGTNLLTGTLGIGNGGTGANSYTAGQLLSYNGTSFVSTSTIGNNQLAHSTIVLNGVTLTLGDTSDTISAASSTLLANNNTFSGNDTFSNPITGSVFGNAGTATALQTARTINRVAFNGTADITINAASSTLLTDSNSWSALQQFANATTSLLSAGAIWDTGLANSLLSVNQSGQIVATTSIGTKLLTGTLGVGNGGTGIAATPSYGNIPVGNGTNYTLTATSSLGLPTFTDLTSSIASAYPFQLSGNATSTLTQFNGGLTAFASSTIGSGTQAGGLTINGGATTTGNAYFAGNLSLAGTLSAEGTTGTTSIASGQGFTIGGSQFVVQQGSGNVGIGTTNPGAKLEVDGSIKQYIDGSTYWNTAQRNTSLIGFQGNGNNYFLNYDTADDRVGIGANSATPANELSVDAGTSIGTGYYATTAPTNGLIVQGNVGIGTTNPGAKLEVNGNILGDGTLALTSTTGTTTIAAGQGFTIGGSQFVVQQGSGNVGIGTTNPTTGILSINDNVDPGTTQAALSINNQSGSGGTAVNEYGIYITDTGYNNATPVGIYAEAGTPGVGETSYGVEGISTQTVYHLGVGVLGQSTQANVAGAGVAVGVEGIATSSGSNSGAVGTTYAGYFNNTSTVGGVNYGLVVNSATGGLTTIPFAVDVNGTEAMRVASTGNVGIGTTSPATTLSTQGNEYTTGGLGVGVEDTNAGTLRTTSGIGIGTAPQFYSVTSPLVTIGNSVNTSQINLVSSGASQFGGFAGNVISATGASGNGSSLLITSDNNAPLVFGRFVNGYVSYTENARFDGSGNFGIGTTTPGALLSANGNILGNGTLALTGTTGTTTIAAGQGFTIGGSQFVVQQGSGNVGIGTTNPQSILNLYAPSGPVLDFGNSSKLLNLGMDSTGAFYLNDQSAGTTRFYITPSGHVGIGNYYASSYLPVNGLDVAANMSIGYGNGGAIAAPSNGLLVSGNVGIGTTTPAATFDVYGGITANGSGNYSASQAAGPAMSMFDNAGTGYIQSLYQNVAWEPLMVEASSYSFLSSGSTQGLYQNSSGNVGIGTTTPSNLLTVNGGDLQVYNSAGETRVRLTNTSTNGHDYWLISGGSGGDFAGGDFGVYDATAGQVALALNSSHDVGVGALAAGTSNSLCYSTSGTNLSGLDTLATCSSDERLKENITSLDGSTTLAQLMELNPVSFDWNPQFASGTPEQFGLIAQQVQKVWPNLISTTSPTALTPGGTLSLNFNGLFGPIVAAIQELDQQLTALETTITGFADSFTTNQLAFNRATGDDLTATNVTAQQLCATKSDGTPVCVTGDQLAALLSAAAVPQTTESVSSSVPQNPSTNLPKSVSSATSSSGSSATPPIIQINGSNPAFIQVGATYNDLGATITGSTADLNLGIKTFLNGTLTSNIVIDTAKAATDTVDYVATDQNGLTATSTRTVIVEQSQPTPPLPSPVLVTILASTTVPTSDGTSTSSQSGQGSASTDASTSTATTVITDATTTANASAIAATSTSR